MAINLKKGQGINLDKNVNDLSQVTVGLGWDVRKEKKGFLAGLMGGKEEDYDLDAIAFLLDANGKVANLGNDRLVGGDVIFFNNLRHPSGNIWHSGDNRTGGTGGRADDEQICVKLTAIENKVQKILFLVSIYQGEQKGQHFGKVENAFMRIVDAKGREMVRYDLSSDSTYANMRTMIFGEVMREGSEWKFNAIGNALPTDSFVTVLKTLI